MFISEAAKTSKLAVDLLLIAVRDLRRSKNTLEAALWFMGDDFGYWAEMANSPYLDPLNVFRAQLNPSRALVLMARMRRIIVGYDALPEECGYTRADVVALAMKIQKTLEEIGRKEKSKKRQAFYRRQATGEVKYANNKFIRLENAEGGRIGNVAASRVGG